MLLSRRAIGVLSDDEYLSAAAEHLVVGRGVSDDVGIDLAGKLLALEGAVPADFHTAGMEHLLASAVEDGDFEGAGLEVCLEVKLVVDAVAIGREGIGNEELVFVLWFLRYL